MNFYLPFCFLLGYLALLSDLASFWSEGMLLVLIHVGSHLQSWF